MPIVAGDLVCKKSRKPFENKKRTAHVTSIYLSDKFTGDYMLVASLKGCISPVPFSCLTNDNDELILMLVRDEENYSNE